jgi:hypothetical protein
VETFHANKKQPVSARVIWRLLVAYGDPDNKLRPLQKAVFRKSRRDFTILAGG